MALFAKTDHAGKLQLVNHLGISLGENPEEILTNLQHGHFEPRQITSDDGRRASDHDYATYVRDVDASTPARFNADPRLLFEASGSAGKIALFAVRLDTFEAPKETSVFYIGTNNPDDLTELRRLALTSFAELPIAAEYLHRDAFDIAKQYGKDTFLLIRWLGTGRLPALFALKNKIDGFVSRLPFAPNNFCDRVLQILGSRWPEHLPTRILNFRDRFDHYLMLKVSGTLVEETRTLLDNSLSSSSADYFLCSAKEAASAFLHRFAAAGAAVRYRAVHEKTVGNIVALDIALPRNEMKWEERLPPDIERSILKKLYYGHFFCHVFHQDYILEKNEDWLEIEHKMLNLLDQRRAKYPAEHNVGHLYSAGRELVAHYQALDPCNCFNAGIGQTSKGLRWHGKQR